MAKNRPAHRPPVYHGEYPYRLHKGRGRIPRTPLMGDFEAGEEEEGEFTYRSIPRNYPSPMHEDHEFNLDSAVTPMNIAIGVTVAILGIAALAYFANKNNTQATAVENPNIL